jgi:hypothetical protein
MRNTKAIAIALGAMVAALKLAACGGESGGDGAGNAASDDSSLPQGNEPVELTDDWYAQDSAGNIW